MTFQGSGPPGHRSPARMKARRGRGAVGPIPDDDAVGRRRSWRSRSSGSSAGTAGLLVVGPPVEAAEPAVGAAPGALNSLGALAEDAGDLGTGETELDDAALVGREAGEEGLDGAVLFGGDSALLRARSGGGRPGDRIEGKGGSTSAVGADDDAVDDGEAPGAEQAPTAAGQVGDGEGEGLGGRVLAGPVGADTAVAVDGGGLAGAERGEGAPVIARRRDLGGDVRR